MTTVTEYVAANGITVEIVKSRGWQTRDGWEHQAYVLRLHKGDKVSPDLPWMQGSGVEEMPDDRPDSVVDALLSDAYGVIDAGSFEDWADDLGYDLGYDTDSLRAFRTYEACRVTAGWLGDFLCGGSLDDLRDLERL